jgi:hypothetical protein
VRNHGKLISQIKPNLKMKTTALLFAILLLSVAAPVFGQTWGQTSAPTNAWTAVASSADGTGVVAAGSHFIYTSTDYGSTWTSNNAPNFDWTSVASSADGAKLVAAGGGAVYTNSGTTWALAFAAPKDGSSTEQNITSVASSADGVTLMAASSFGDPLYSPKPLLYVSTNSGASWINATNSPPGQPWVSVVSSADGSKLAAATTISTLGGSSIFTSTNAGTTWASNTVPLIFSLADSAGGNELFATGLFGLLISTNAGSNWTAVLPAPAVNMTNRIACSTNGLVLFGLGRTNIYSSFNGGTTWATNTAPLTNWSAIAVSADGLRAAAAVSGGGIYVLQSPSAPVLSIALSSGAVVLSWSAPAFSLQSATHLTDTFSNVSGATSPYTNAITSPQTYFRLKGN